jgi:asparagine synthase (glutamine-hydrolysing)
VPWEYKDYRGREKGLLREAMKEWLPERVLNRKKSPYPKTHNPAFLNAVTAKLRDIISQPTPLTEIADIKALEQLLTHSDHVQWYGQLMNLPQTIAFFIQLDYWMKKYNIILNLE